MRPPRSPDGASAVEYAIIVGAVAAVVAIVVAAFGAMVHSSYDHSCRVLSSTSQSSLCK